MLWAMKNGANFAIQGWGMLIEQAAESYLIWKKIRPDTSAILKQINVTSSSQILRR
jgi:shikimate dehydrogenase